MAGQILNSTQNNWDAYLIKTDSAGSILWTKTFNALFTEYLFDVTQTTDSGYVAVGSTQADEPTSRKIFIVKTSSDGTLLWSKTIGWIDAAEAHTVKETSDGGLIICGEAYFGICLIKTDANGEVIWGKKYDDSTAQNFGELGYSAEETADGGYIITGRAENSFSSGGSDIYLAKTDAGGTIQWNKAYGGADHEFANCVKQTTDGGYIIAGYTLSFGAGGEDAYLIKTDADGDTLWSKTYGGSLRDFGYSVSQTSDGGYILGGYTETFGSGSNDYFLVKVTATGNHQWSRTFGANTDERAFDVQQTDDRGYVIAGYTNGFDLGFEHFYLVKTDSSGNSGCNQGSAGTSVGNFPAVILNESSASTSDYSVSSQVPVTGSVGADTTLCTSILSTDVSDFLFDSSVYTFPNPFNAQLNIAGLNSKTLVTIFDLSGRKVLQMTTMDEQVKIDTNYLLQGLYVLKISSKTTETNMKILKF